jgi:glycosyltransferase involved in cell wall biosynthesis
MRLRIEAFFGLRSWFGDHGLAPKVKENGMRILLLGRSHLPAVGGAEMSTHHLAAALSDQGHHVVVLTGKRRRSPSGMADEGLRLVRRAPYRRDDRLGYPTIRSVQPLEVLMEVATSFGPDVVVVTGTDPAFARKALLLSRPWPTVISIRDVASAELPGGGDEIHADAVMTNSRFIAYRAGSFGPIATFVPSLFDRRLYEVPTSRRVVLFVNPVEKKGVGIAWALAGQRPDIPFAFVPSWAIRRRARRDLRLRAKRAPNVEIRDTKRTPAELYGDTKLLLVPSIYPEAWSRVASEAQASGIPVLGSRLGGIPEAVGPGGILVDPTAPIEDWVAALSLLWDDATAYARYSELARAHSRRTELKVRSVLSRFESVIGQAVRQHRLVCLRSSIALEGVP